MGMSGGVVCQRTDAFIWADPLSTSIGTSMFDQIKRIIELLCQFVVLIVAVELNPFYTIRQMSSRFEVVMRVLQAQYARNAAHVVKAM